MNSRRRMGRSGQAKKDVEILPDLSPKVCDQSHSIPAASERTYWHLLVWRPGLIVTADEALSEDCEFAVTLSGGVTVPSQLVGDDPTTDVALMRLGGSYGVPGKAASGSASPSTPPSSTSPR